MNVADEETLGMMQSGEVAPTIDEIAGLVYEIAESHGWHEERDTIPVKLLMIHTEISEATDDYRGPHGIEEYEVDGKPCGFGIELADAVIRIMDLAEMAKIDLQHCIMKKMLYNEKRPYRHGGKRI